MDRSGNDYLQKSGAVIARLGSPPTSFGDAPAELRAALDRCVLVDRSHFSRIESSGPDLLGLLHRISTADLASLPPGQGHPTVLTTPKGRIVERIVVHRVRSGNILLIGAPDSSTRIMTHLDRYTFSENTGLSDVTGQSRLFSLMGPQAVKALSEVNLDPPATFESVQAPFGEGSIEVLGHDALSATGYSLLVSPDNADVLWQRLADAVSRLSGRPAGEEALEGYRLLRGIPASGTELNEDYNPLEAGLRDAVSFDKGCYVGQEVIARLQNYDKITRSIVGIELESGVAPPQRGTRLFQNGREVGTLTSCTVPPGFTHAVGLAYVKHRFVEPDAELQIESPDGPELARLRGLPEEPATRNESAP